MRRALLKMAFYLTVLILTLLFLIPGRLAMDALFPGPRAPSGPQGDVLFPGFLILSLSVILADRLISALFRAAGWTEGRWSVFSHGPRRRCRP